MDGTPPADRRAGAFLLRRLSGSAQSQLLVDVRRHPVVPARRADRDRHHPGDALHTARRHGVQFRRAHHARRELRLAAALPALQRRLDVLHRRLCAHVPRPLLRFVQGAARGFMDPWRDHLPADDGARIPRLHATMKDGFMVVLFCLFFGWFVFYVPNYLGHADNYIQANPGVTPTHIVPEWYYLPFYAILRSIPNKLAGVIAMFGSILVLAFLPWLDTSRV